MVRCIVYVCKFVSYVHAPFQIFWYAMSAEPGHKALYSIDLHHRMIWQIIGMSLTYRSGTNFKCNIGDVFILFRPIETEVKRLFPIHNNGNGTG